MPAPSINLNRACLARRMMEFGVRPHLIAYMMKLPEPSVMEWYEQVIGKRPNRGPLKNCAASYIKTRSDARRLAVFCTFYRKAKRTAGPMMMEQLFLAMAHFNKIYPDQKIDGTLAWMAAREFDTNVLRFKYCSSCRLHYLYYLQSPQLRKCPFCPSRCRKSC